MGSFWNECLISKAVEIKFNWACKSSLQSNFRKQSAVQIVITRELSSTRHSSAVQGLYKHIRSWSWRSHSNPWEQKLGWNANWSGKKSGCNKCQARKASWPLYSKARSKCSFQLFILHCQTLYPAFCPGKLHCFSMVLGNIVTFADTCTHVAMTLTCTHVAHTHQINKFLKIFLIRS